MLDLAGRLEGEKDERMPSMAEAHYGVLELIARGRPLPEVLTGVVEMVEAELSEAYCSIVLYDAETNTLRHGAASRLPHAYAILTDGLVAGPSVGSCGAAAFLGEPVIVTDIATHPNWKGVGEIALRYGLRACWSTPIKSPSGAVLGTFAVYRAKPGPPDTHELDAVEQATHSAAIAISRALQDEERRELVDALERRVQQLTTLHKVSHLLEAGQHLDARLLGDVAGRLPAALPSARVVRIRLGDLVVSSAPFDPELVVFSEPFGAPPLVGSIDLGRTRAADASRISVCPEERELVHSIAQMLSRHVCRVQAESRLEQERGLLSIASRAAKLGGVLIDMETWDFVLSDEACAMLEVEPGVPLNRPQAAALVHPDHIEALRATFWRALGAGRTFDAEFEVTTPSGRNLWTRLVGDVVKDTSGKIVQVRGALQDIGERRRLEEQVRQAQKMEAVGRLAGGVAHDFNNLLSVILGYSQMVGDQLEGSASLRADVREIEVAVRRASELTSQLLAFSRQGMQKPRVIDLGDVIRGMEKMLARLLGVDIELAVRRERGLSPVFADRGQIEQVIMNLVLNARDAMPRGGRIQIEVSSVDLDLDHAEVYVDVTPGPYVRLAVSDTGEGMDAATRARVFEPFFTTKEQGKGTGLGLSTVWGIVTQTGGHITVSSEPGAGARFEVYLPLADGPVEEEPSSQRLPARLDGTETILLVEDDEQLRALTSAVLTRYGYRVLAAVDGKEALAVAAAFEGPIQLVLTDVVMPHMGGVELVRQLAELRPSTRALFVSGYTEEAMTRNGALIREGHFLAKPVTPQALVRRVREILDA